jgi:serine/threonine-protein kinase RsbT
MNDLAASVRASPADAFLNDIKAGIDNEQVAPLRSDEHVVALRKLVRERAVDLRLSLVDQTKLITAASELARNTLKYGGGGEVFAYAVASGMRQGIGLTFVDAGPGIDDIAQAMTDGYTSGGGLGLGLGGAKRLVDMFSLYSRKGEGTAVTIIKWERS